MPVAIYVLAVGVRLAFLSEARHNPLYQFLTIDERTHHQVAEAICNDALPPTVYLKSPLYVYFLGNVYRLIGVDSLRARFVQVFIAGLMPVLIFLIGRRLFGPALGLCAGILAAVYWTFVFFSTELLDVTLTTVLYLSLAYVLVRVDDDRTWKWFLAGTLLGVGAVSRPNILVFAPVLAVMIVLANRRRGRETPPSRGPNRSGRTGLVRVALLIVGCALPIAPVTLRNVFVAGEPALIGAWGPGVFYMSNNPRSDGKNAVCPQAVGVTADLKREFNEDPWFRGDVGTQGWYVFAAQELGHRPTYREARRLYFRLSWDYLRQYPRKFLTDTLKRLCYLFNAYEYPMNKDLYHFTRSSWVLTALSWLHLGLIGPLGVLGLAIVAVRRPWPRGVGYCLAMILTLAVPSIFFLVISRYRVPVVCLLMPFACYAVRELIGSLARPVQWWRPVAMTAGLAALVVFANVNVFGYRPPYHGYLLYNFAMASAAVGRDDLRDEAVKEIEQLLADESHRPVLSAGTMGLLFRHHHQRGNLERTAHYGLRIVERREKTDAWTLAALVDVLVRLDRRDEAKDVLDLLVRRFETQPNPLLAWALLRYGTEYDDRPVLENALQQYEALVRVHISEADYHHGRAAAREALERLCSPASSSAPASRPGPSSETRP